MSPCWLKVWHLQLYSILHDPVPYRLPVIISIRASMIRLPIFPIRPVQPPHARAQDSKYPTRQQTDTDWPVCIAIQRPVWILRISFQPDVIERNDLGLFETWFAGGDTVTGKTDDSFYSDM